MYLLDTNICIFLKNRKSPQVLKKLKKHIYTGIYISSITVAELQFGVYNSDYVEKNKILLLQFLAPFYILNFDDNDAEQFGKIRSELKKRGKIIGSYSQLLFFVNVAES